MRKGRLKHATFSFDVVCAWDGGQQSLGHYLVELDLSNGYAEPNSLLKLDMAQVSVELCCPGVQLQNSESLGRRC